MEKLEGHKVKLDVSVAQGEVQRAFERAYRRLAGRVTVPGFRRGKTPRPVLERHVGREAFREEALDAILPVSYSQALDLKGLDPIAQPEVEVVKFEEGEPFVFRATVEVKPEVKLGAYTGMGLKAEPKPVEDTAVEAQLEAIRENRAELEPAEPGTELAAGLFAVIDYHGTIDGNSFPGSDVEGALVRMGGDQLEPEVDQALAGAKAGDTRECHLDFPPDHPNAELRGKKALIKITVREVKKKKLPELADELAEEVAGTDLAGLKERIRSSLEERAKRDAWAELTREVVEKVTQAAEVDVPASLVERRAERLKTDMAERLRSQGLDVERYLKIAGLERDRWEKDLRTRAEREVKRELVLEAVARREGITATDAEVEFEMARIAAATRQKPDLVRKYFRSSPGRLESLREGIISDKAVDYLVRSNAVTPLPGTVAEGKAEKESKGSADGRGSEE